MIRILLADDHTIILDGLRALLESQSDLKVIGVAADGREAVRLTLEHQPDVVVMDIAMPNLNGIEASQHIFDSSPATRVIILSMHSNPEHVFRALQAGASGYLVKESAGTEVIAAVRAVCNGQRYLSQKIADTMIDDYIEQRQAASPLDSLSGREREILQLIVEGKSSAQAAQILSLSPKTVESYRSRLMQKLNINDLPSLVKFAVQHGLTPLD